MIEIRAAAAARAQRRPAAADQVLRGEVLRPVPQGDPRPDAARAGRAGAPQLAGQCARAGKRAGPRLHHGAWRKRSMCRICRNTCASRSHFARPRQRCSRARRGMKHSRPREAAAGGSSGEGRWQPVAGRPRTAHRARRSALQNAKTRPPLNEVLQRSRPYGTRFTARHQNGTPLRRGQGRGRKAKPASQFSLRAVFGRGDSPAFLT